MKRKIFFGILILLFIVVVVDLATLNIRVKDYIQEMNNYPDTLQVYANFSTDEYIVYESPDVDGFNSIPFEELPKSMYNKIKVLDFLMYLPTQVILL